MAGFMVVCRFKPDTVMSEVFAVVAEEQAAVAVLVGEGLVGEIRLALSRQTVFIEVFAAGVDEATTTIERLPMAKWWDLDVYELGAPS